MIKRCVRHHSWESPCHAAMRCVGATHVLHSVFADMEDDLTVGTVVKTACYQFAVVPAIRRQLRVDGYDFVFLQISGSRIRLARGAGCQPQLGTQVAKGQAAGSSVPSAAREPPRALAACHLGVYDRQFRVDGYDFVFFTDFWQQN